MSLLAKHAIKAIIFDHDGTLVDSEPAHLQCWQKVLAPLNVNLNAKLYKQHLSGTPSSASAQWLVQRFNLTATPESLLAKKLDYLQAYLDREAFPLRPGATEVVKALFKHFPLAIASGAKRHEVQHSIESHGLHGYFQTVCTQEDVSRNKPAPDVYLKAAANLGVSAHQCLAIEDSDPGQQAAIDAGMPCLRLIDEDPRVGTTDPMVIYHLSDILERL